MKSKPLQGLTIVEVPYRNMKRVYYRREFDDYKLCGTYYKAGVPFEVVQASYHHENYPLEEGEFFSYDPAVFSEALGALCGSICNEAAAGIRKGNAVMLTGGGCEHAPGIIGALQQALGADTKIGLIWLDAHGDINTPETSISGRPGGMPLAVCTGLGCESWQKAAGIEKPLPLENVLLTDGRELDDAEATIIKGGQILYLDTADFNRQQVWRRKVKEFADRVDVIFLHMDQDILDAQYIPNSLMPTPGGPELVTVLENIKAVMETGKVLAFSLVSVTFVNGMPGQDIRTLNAMRMLGAGLENWKSCPITTAQ